MAFDPKNFLKHLTEAPGVYQMLDHQGQILYVGKAKNLKKRVSSYFRQQLDHPKTQVLVKKIADIRIIATQTENEALLLENNLIKQHRPRYNILFKDDKSFPYIHLTHQTFPRLMLYRSHQKPKGDYFGPYVNAHAVREAVNLLQKLFLLRNCSDSFFHHRSRPCLQYHIKRCSAPCVGYIDATTYQQDSAHAKAFLQGQSQTVIQALIARMEQAAHQQAYEQAAFYRDQIQALQQLAQRQRQSHQHCDVIALASQHNHCAIQVVHIRDGEIIGNHSYFPVNFQQQMAEEVLESFISQFYLTEHGREIPTTIFIDRPLSHRAWLSNALAESSQRSIRLSQPAKGQALAWLNLANDNAVLALNSHLSSHHLLQQRYHALAQILDWPDKKLWRLECFDISHSQGEATVASNVVFDEQGPCKNAYRLFTIEGITPGDDYAAIGQALTRRFRQAQPLPDLLVIDGGRGQLNQAKAILAQLGIEGMVLMGIAKGEGRKPGLETLWINDDQTALQLPAHSPALHLLQHLRDEAHRFALKTHRVKRKKKRRASSLEQIPGIGSHKRQVLLNYFGGLLELQKASVQDLQKVPGIGPALADTIFQALHPAV